EKNIDELKYFHNLIDEFFKKYGISDWRNNIDECIDLLADTEVRNEFITLSRNFIRAMDSVLPDKEALRYTEDLKILSFIKESARNRYRDDKLSIRDASRKIREIVEEFLISKGVDPKIPPTPILDDAFLEKLKVKPSRAKADELKHAIIEYIENHYEEDPELYERFSERLNRVLEEYKANWEVLARELEKIREDIKKGREAERTFGFDPKKEMPFFGLLKREIYGKIPIEELKDEEIEFLVKLTRKIIEIIKKETNSPDFWDRRMQVRRLKTRIILSFDFSHSSELFTKRNEIAQKLIELSYHIFGRK
ncbi:MAG: type I restriction enzyme endonuclease domain-containing protein, partial [Aquificaceae bacterium]